MSKSTTLINSEPLSSTLPLHTTETLSVWQWVHQTIVVVGIALGAAFVLPTRISNLLGLMLLVYLVILAWKNPFNGLVFSLLAQSFISMFKRIQFAHAGNLQEFNNPVSLFAQAIVLTIIVRMLWRIASTGKFRRPSPILIPITAILLCYIFSLLYTPSLIGGIFSLRGVAIPLMLYFIGRYVVSSAERIRFVLIIMAVLTIITGAYGLKQSLAGFFSFEYQWAIQYVGIRDVGWFLVWNNVVYLRVFSTLATPFEFAALMMIAPMLLFVVFQICADRRIQIITLLGIAVTLGGLVATGVRGSWVGCIAGVGTYVLLWGIHLPKRITRTLMKWGIPVMLGLALMTVIAWPKIQSRAGPIIQRIFSLSNSLQAGQMQMRYQRWQQAFGSTFEHPLGTGAGSSGFFGRRFGNSAAITPDSLYVQALIDFGIPGPLAFIGLFLMLIVVSYHRLTHLHDRHLRSVATLIITMTVAIAVHGLTTPLQEGNNTIAWFWLLAGIGDNLLLIEQRAAQAITHGFDLRPLPRLA